MFLLLFFLLQPKVHKQFRPEQFNAHEIGVRDTDGEVLGRVAVTVGSPDTVNIRSADWMLVILNGRLLARTAEFAEVRRGRFPPRFPVPHKHR
mmetsp:Transcript_24557/g.61338  ORF Transcript_24557/g.61338 Transcript_24557/m.61338 type:complete len:93 (-) Transcript_24557:180-458(-)